MKEDLNPILIASLLHDVGKFSQRVGNETRWRHEAFTENFLKAFSERLGDQAGEIIELAARHHSLVSDRSSLIVKIADLLSSAERYSEERDRIAPDRAAMLSICSRVTLLDTPYREAFLPLRKLSLRREDLFPVEADRIAPDEYRGVWDEFADEVRGIEGRLPYGTWLSLLRVYTRAIPSATPWEREGQHRTVPDISLYDHAKTTGAIAAALAAFDEEELPTSTLSELSAVLRQFSRPDFDRLLSQSEPANRPLFLMLRGDIGGIQGWLYRITRPEAETYRRVAKRLRGRSFYIQILTMAVAEWVRRRAGMPPSGLLFCGGGGFDLLLPLTDRLRGALPQWERELQRYMYEEHMGELGVELAYVELSAADFYNFSSVYRRISAEMDRRKLRRSAAIASDPDFWEPFPLQFICPCCRITPVNAPDEQCRSCRQQEVFGERLPRSEYLLIAHEEARGTLEGIEAKVDFDGLGISIAIAASEECESAVRSWDGTGELTLLKRNDPDRFLAPMGWSVGENRPVCDLWLSSSLLPIAKRRWLAPGRSAGEEVNEGETLDFGEIAALSVGAEMIGVLRMDVDRLGAIFAMGIDPPSISRSATLSDAMDLFFNGWLPQICLRATRMWRDELPEDDPRRDLVENAFYVVYSGGDDLMIIGPWNGVMTLAGEIREDFTLYCGDNPNLTISAGIAVVKPNLPIQLSANMAGEALDRSKSEGRNRITLFNRTVRWTDYAEAIRFGRDIAKAIKRGRMPRTFPHFLIRLRRDEINWVPKLYYVASRRLQHEVIRELNLLERACSLMNRDALAVAASYAILYTRGGSR